MGYYGQTDELIRRSGAEARLLGHSYVGSVHLLLAMCQMSGGTAQLLRSFGIEPEFLRQLIMLLYGVGRAELPLPQGLTRSARRILRQAAREARRQGFRAELEKAFGPEPETPELPIDWDTLQGLLSVAWTERTVTDDHISGRWDADDFSYIAIGDIDAARALAIMQ